MIPKPKKKGRPSIPKEKVVPKQNIMIRLPDFIAEKVDNYAEELRLSRTRTIEDIIEKFFQEREK